MKLELAGTDLARIIGSVIPMADSGKGNVPVLATVHLKAASGEVTATATDRFAIGCCRADATVLEDGEVIIPLADAKRIVAAFKTTRMPVPIAVTGNVVKVGYSGEVGFQAMSQSYPIARISSVLASALNGNDPINVIGFDAKHLAAFSKSSLLAGKRIATVLRFTAANKPVGVVIGDNFAGAISPMRLDNFATTADWVTKAHANV